MRKLLATFVVFAILCGIGCTQKIIKQTNREKDRYTFVNGTNFKHAPSWHVEEMSHHVTVVGPEADFKIHVVETGPVVSASDEAIALWKKINPSFSYPVATAESVPAERGFDGIYQIAFNIPSSESKTVMAIALSYKEKTSWLLIDTTNDLLSRRFAELMLIVQSFKIAGMPDAVTLSSLPKSWSEKEQKEFHDFIIKAAHELKVPGAAVLVVDKNGNRLFHDEIGVKDIATQKPVTLDTPFMIGSTTKPLTTLMMARLVDKNVISWDTKIKDALKDFSVNDAALTDQLTMRNSVSASTGMPRRDFEFIFAYKGVDAQQRIKEMSIVTPTTKIGETFQYSNSLFMAGGYAAAQMYRNDLGLEQSYILAMNDLVFKPLGMKRTTLSFTDATKLGGASLHAINIDDRIVRLPLERERAIESVMPAGAIWSTAEDLARYAVLELNDGVVDGKRVLGKTNLLERRKPGIKMGDNMHYGLGLIINDSKGLNIVGHDGNTIGFSTHMSFIPKSGVALIVLTNLSGANSFLHVVQEKYLELTFGAPKRADALLAFTSASRKAHQEQLSSRIKRDVQSTAWIKKFAGEFHDESLGTITIKQKKNGVWQMDTGEWQSDLATLVESNGTESIFLTDAPFNFAFQPSHDANSLKLDADQVKYEFKRVAKNHAAPLTKSSVNIIHRRLDEQVHEPRGYRCWSHGFLRNDDEFNVSIEA